LSPPGRCLPACSSYLSPEVLLGFTRLHHGTLSPVASRSIKKMSYVARVGQKSDNANRDPQPYACQRACGLCGKYRGFSIEQGVPVPSELACATMRGLFEELSPVYLRHFRSPKLKASVLAVDIDVWQQKKTLKKSATPFYSDIKTFSTRRYRTDGAFDLVVPNIEHLRHSCLPSPQPPATYEPPPNNI